MRHIRTLTAITIAAAAVLATATPAQAASGYSRCPANRMCVFTGLNGSGAIAIYKNGDVNLADSTGPTGMNNNIESMINRTSSNWRFFEKTNYNGKEWVGGPGGGANVVPALRNKISSLKRA